MTTRPVLIAGAGPAGLVLAYQLASNGVPVRVLEQHPDFERELRGELIGPSVLPVLERLGVLPILEQRGFARRDVVRRMFIGHHREVQLPTGGGGGALISQPGLLTVLDELCRATGRYTLDLDTAALRTVTEGDRVVGLEVRQAGREQRIDADLTVVCNGRGSKLRKTEGVETELAEKPDDTLWVRLDLSDTPEVLPKDVLVHMFGKGVVVVLFATTRSRLQIAYSAPGTMGELRRDRTLLRDALLPHLSEPLRTIVARKLDGEVETQLLKVSIDRLKRWSRPGLLFLGDAAHTMGPAGAQGLNLAIRDAIVAADHLIEAQGAWDEALPRIEAERRPEIEAAQAGQLRAYGMVQRPLFVQHLMFSILGLVMRVKRFPAPADEVLMPRHVATQT